MKRIGIVTITSGQNYGNRLQNYALQKVLERLGYQVDTIKNNNGYNTQTIQYKLKYSVRKILHYKIDNVEIRRYRFDRFNKNYINICQIPLSGEHEKNNKVNDYYMFIAGSDQVWNPLYDCNSEIEFLTFAPKKKRISYAASFGLDSIPEKYVPFISKLLKEFRCISVREKKAAEIVYALSKRQAKIVLDPTMLLGVEDWKKLEKKPTDIKQKYIAIYFLGETDEKCKNFIIKMCRKYQCIPVYLYSDMTSEKSERNRKSFTYDPREFLWIINHSQIVLTDSFHACVFSILYNKPFKVFKRITNGTVESQSRIITLLENVGLQDVKEINGMDTEDIANINYEIVLSKLHPKIEESINYLYNALNEE